MTHKQLKIFLMSRNLFNSVQLPKVVKATHNMSYRNLISCNHGFGIPFYGEDCLPSDVWKCNSNMFVRLSPLALPCYASLEVFATYFKVPRRLIEPTFDYFITGGRNGQAVVASTCITLKEYVTEAKKPAGTLVTGPGSLADFLGYPADAGIRDVADIAEDENVPIDLYRVYAYQMVMDDYFTDENLSDPYITINNDGTRKTLKEFIDDGTWPDLFAIRKVCYRKDSFLSSALPFAQRGPAVSVGVDTSAFEVSIDTVNDGDDQYLLQATTNRAGATYGSILRSSETIQRDSASYVDVTLSGQAEPGSDGFSFGLEDLRKAVKLQRFFETNARGGSRLIEQCLAHFGVRPKDGRVQRPEMVGGGKFEIQISEVLQTSKTDGTSALGSYAGRGIANSSSPFGKTFCDEHCYIIGIMCIRPRLTLFEGLSRHLQRSDRFDYAFPEFEGLGEQEIKVSEVNIFSPETLDHESQLGETFGFAPRYHEYKSHPSEIHGKFRTDLRAWHMGRTFGNSKPVLNDSFMYIPQDYSIFAVTDPTVEHYYFCIDSRVWMNRPLHKYSTPSGLV